MNKDIKICFMGSPTFGKNVLEKLIEEFNVVLVVTKPDSYTKGGRVIIEQPVKILAKEKNIKIFQPENLSTPFKNALSLYLLKLIIEKLTLQKIKYTKNKITFVPSNNTA